MPEDSPVAIIIVGINGAGKTTFYQNEVKPRFSGSFINADIWERDNFPGEVGQHTREAARWAGEQREAKIESRESFAMESVFFSERHNTARKASEAGYQVELIHIHVESADLARNRVEQRVADGGHNVSKELIDQRYNQIAACVKRAAPYADRLDVFENSRFAESHRHLLRIENGKVTKMSRELPGSINPGNSSPF